MTQPFDIEQFRLSAGFAMPTKQSKRPPHHRTGERFLKGPIPWAWVEKAGSLPGKSLHVALLLWQEVGWRKTRTVKFCLNGRLPGLLNRQSARRGIRQLEAAGLVSVIRKPGHGLEVTLLDYQQNGDNPSCDDST